MKKSHQVVVICENCGDKVTRYRSQANHGRKHHFCNRECHHEYQRNTKEPWTDKTGYRRFTRSGHPTAGSKGYILEHWFVMYKENPSLALYAKENRWTIHHRNGIRNDNQIENLEWRLPGRHPQGWTIAAMIETIKMIGYNVEPA